MSVYPPFFNLVAYTLYQISFLNPTWNYLTTNFRLEKILSKVNSKQTLSIIYINFIFGTSVKNSHHSSSRTFIKYVSLMIKVFHRNVGFLKYTDSKYNICNWILLMPFPKKFHNCHSTLLFLHFIEKIF